VHVFVILINNLLNLPLLNLLHQFDFTQVFLDPPHDLIFLLSNFHTDTLTELLCDDAFISKKCVKILDFDVFVNIGVVDTLRRV
jgi:hypothetical protein